ncbi:MAG TPA: hypothetical protein DCQ06_09875, partial [Myxococcales bacterium]|nr:hypothetical protein [Myxococcales bacterium]
MQPVEDIFTVADQLESGDAGAGRGSDVQQGSSSDSRVVDSTEGIDTSTNGRVVDGQASDGVDPQPDLGADAQAADVPADVDEDTEGQLDVQGTIDGAGSDGGCVVQKELCDGIDNDCDGQTDEDFSLTVGPGLSFAVGQSCDNPTCPKGVIVCANPKYAWCSTCPQPIPKTAILTGPNSKASPLQVTGGFVEQAGLLSAVKFYQGSTSQQPEGSAVMALDVDADGDIDLVVCDGESSVTLFTQTAPWTFDSQLIHTSQDGVRAVAATLNDKGATRLIFGGGGLWAYDRDANGKWVDVSAKTQLKLPTDFGPVSHILPADMDRDGRLDLVVSLFPCKSGARGLLLYRAKGDGTYVEQSKSLGLDIDATLWTTMQSDYNGDGLSDLMVLTESCPPMWGVGLYLAQPLGSKGPIYKIEKADGVFTDPNESTEFSPMGADVADVNADGVLDYLLAEIELWGYQGQTNPLDLLDPWLYADKSNVFLLSQPSGGRARAGLHAGLWAPLSSTNKTMVAWTPAWSDLDHDGHLDLALSHAPHYDAWLLNDLGGMRPVIWRNDGQGQFIDMSVKWGLPTKHSGRSLVLADLDGDGDQDLAIGGMAEPARLWR